MTIPILFGFSGITKGLHSLKNRRFLKPVVFALAIAAGRRKGQVQTEPHGSGCCLPKASAWTPKPKTDNPHRTRRKNGLLPFLARNFLKGKGMVIKMKRSLFRAFVLLLTSAILLLTGCSVLGEIFNKTPSEEYKSPGTLAKERQTEIMECFINKDEETLKSFFSEYVIENYPDLDTQIETALDYLDGEIASYDEPLSSATGGFDKKCYIGDT